MHAFIDVELRVAQRLQAGVADFISDKNLDLGCGHETFLLTIVEVLGIKRWYGNSLPDVGQTSLFGVR